MGRQGRPLSDGSAPLPRSGPEELLGEVPAILRRVRTLLLVLMITVPVFLMGLIVVLWRLAS